MEEQNRINLLLLPEKLPLIQTSLTAGTSFKPKEGANPNIRVRRCSETYHCSSSGQSPPLSRLKNTASLIRWLFCRSNVYKTQKDFTQIRTDQSSLSVQENTAHNSTSQCFQGNFINRHTRWAVTSGFSNCIYLFICNSVLL